MYCADAGTGQHGYQGLGHHWHVDDYAIATAYIISYKYAGKPGCLFEQFGVRYSPTSTRDGTVVDNRSLITAAMFHVQIDCVITGVNLATGVPSIVRCVRVVQDTIPPLVPMNVFSRPCPEFHRVL
jgi:hypothetical protein